MVLKRARRNKYNKRVLRIRRNRLILEDEAGKVRKQYACHSIYSLEVPASFSFTSNEVLKGAKLFIVFHEFCKQKPFQVCMTARSLSLQMVSLSLDTTWQTYG